MGYMRIVRLLKTAKLLRVVRLLRSFKELRLVLDSILGSMKSMVWTVALILAISFMFAICFMHGVTEYAYSAGQVRDADHVRILLDSWGSVAQSILTLFSAATGGDDWSSVAEPLKSTGFHFYLFFIVYIAFFLFVITNCVTSIFVDSVREFSDKDQSQIIAEQIAHKQEYIARIGALYRMMDNDGSGEVTFEEFCKFSADPRMAAFAASLELETNDLQQFFSILSTGGQRAVDVESFVVGCFRLKGMAKSMDVVDCLIHVRSLQGQVAEINEVMAGQFAELKSMVGGGILRM